MKKRAYQSTTILFLSLDELVNKTLHKKCTVYKFDSLNNKYTNTYLLAHLTSSTKQSGERLRNRENSNY